MTETQCPNGEVRLLAHVQRRSGAFAPKTIYEIHLSLFDSRCWEPLAAFGSKRLTLARACPSSCPRVEDGSALNLTSHAVMMQGPANLFGLTQYDYCTSFFGGQAPLSQCTCLFKF